MALSIKNPDTDNVVRRYAKLHKTSCTRAVHIAVTEALRREGHPVDDAKDAAIDFMDFVRELQGRVAAHPILDERTADEIIGYDDDGLPV